MLPRLHGTVLLQVLREGEHERLPLVQHIDFLPLRLGKAVCLPHRISHKQGTRCLLYTSMGENIIDLICNSCSCDKTEAQEYLDSELQYLHELQDVDDLREGDIELACSNLGLDLDYQEYFINRLAGA